jgi:phage terminase large subunit-like protein
MTSPGRIISRKDEYRTKVITLPAIAERDEPPYRSAGEPLWPTKYDHKALAEIKAAVGPYDWQALYQGSPILTENQEFKPHWIKRIAEVNVDAMSCRRFLTVDTAMSRKAQADFTGFCDNRVNRENFWHLKAWGMKLGPEELVDILFSLHKVHRYEVIGIEKTTYTQGLKPYLDSEQRKRNMFLPIVELSHNQTNKEVRIRGLIPIYASGSVYHIDGQCKELEEQMTHFPVNINDDVIDAVAYQLQVVSGEKGGSAKVFIPDDY